MENQDQIPARSLTHSSLSDAIKLDDGTYFLRTWYGGIVMDETGAEIARVNVDSSPRPSDG
jgi:hypothetical protein